MKVTFDINVLLDVFQKREPHYAASACALSRVISGKLEGVFPAHGLTTLYYLVRKRATRPEAEEVIDQVLYYFQIGILRTVEWRRARKLPLSDFEDAVVATVAEDSGSVFILTRNVDDFEGSPVPATTPTAFLSNLILPS